VGNEVDLFKLPAPYLHDGDGGRYIGTWHTVITRTPDKAWTNWGMYRLMISGQRALGGLIVPTQHIGMHYDLWRGAGQDMPFAVALGTDPVTALLSSMSIPDGVDEADIVGGYRGKPLDVVRCETVDLEVPASAEIVIEGTVSLTETCMEGPFGEYTGYISNSQKQRPVFKVSAITHRKDPILPVVCPGEPVDDHLCMSLSLAADALALLRKKSIPVVMTFIPSEAALHLLVVSVDKSQWQGDSIAHAVGEAIWSAKIGTLLPKIILVDRDIDPTEIGKVLWAFATKCHPQHGIATFPNRDIFPLTPYLYPEEKRDRKCTMVVFDCTWPSVWPQDYAPRKAGFDSLWPLAMQERVLDSWPRYGYRAN
jgi:4-hydroxy-3-polyprenylbenzoate decarboxylase